MLYNIFDSPVGELTVSTDGTYITALHIEGDRYFTSIPKDWVFAPAHPLLQQAGRELKEYFTGTRTAFDVPLKPSGTPFQSQVWNALQAITPGTTETYGSIALSLGKPMGAARAVGTAIGRNPICIMIPCHRVLASNGKLGGFVAGLKCKQQLLAVERN